MVISEAEAEAEAEERKMMSKRHYYACDNFYATQSSPGFRNTWYLLLFDNSESRDKWVDGQNNLAASRVTTRQIARERDVFGVVADAYIIDDGDVVAHYSNGEAASIRS